MENSENLNYSYRGGYYNSEDILEVPAGAMIVPSANVIYNRKGRPVSLKDISQISSYGGSRAFALDADLVGYLGNDISTGKAIGNMVQTAGKNLWFVGNSVANGVQAVSSFTTPIQIGGTRQVETLTATITTVTVGSFNVVVTGVRLTGSPITVPVSVAGGETNSEVAYKIAVALRANSVINNIYYIRHASNTVILTEKLIKANDGTLNVAISANAVGVDTAASSANTTSGAVDYIADLSSTPQLAKWNGSHWENPVQVGLAPQTSTPSLILTSTKSAGFEGLITGSISARLARKRGGSVSIASGASNIVVGDEDSVYATIPAYVEDGSEQDERVWVLYFTFSGRGSQLSHVMFPIEIPESKLDGSSDLGWSSTQGNAKITVISQHASTQADRKIEVEFNDNDLLLLEPYDDYFAAESCKFVAPLGNVMCLIGTGSDSTGFDVSFPNFREAYSPDWRDWFAEVPVSIANSSELGMFWVLTANMCYQAIWTGATQQTAPVVLRQITSKYGAIGEGASVAVNGVLYFLSKGKTPVRISANREIDVEFGTRVKNAFSAFNSTTQISYDENTNSIVWACGTALISYQIDSDLWGASSTVTTINSNIIYSMFSINGNLYLCSWDDVSITPVYTTNQYNAGTGTLNWLAAGSFQTGKYGLNLKDIVEVKAIIEVDAQPVTITFAAYDNYSTSSPETLFAESIAATGVQITVRKLLEALDYESISLRVSGTKGGQTVHLAIVTVDNHEIERQ